MHIKCWTGEKITNLNAPGIAPFLLGEHPSEQDFVHLWSQKALTACWNLRPSKSGTEEGLLGRLLGGVLMSIEVETF